MNPSNPLFDQNQDAKAGSAKPKGITTPGGADEAVALLRSKITDLYENEPNAKEELAESEAAGTHRTKHQQYMHNLSTSGMSLADIQTAWHKYYAELPDNEKHEVWQEFYSEHSKANKPKQAPQQNTHSQHPVTQTHNEDPRTTAEIKNDILTHASTTNRKKKGHAGHSLLFGLSMGAIVSVVMLFGFFNERFLAPFITPSKNVSNTPIIIDPSSAAVGPESKIIIPKINVEIPVIFDEKSIDEHAIQKALESGVIHYANTSNPGEQGNGAIFGHSSNNILNKGNYKFAFVLLKKLENGDLFYVQKGGKRYAYRVYKKTVVTPQEVSVLGTQDKPSTMSLITCDPPGTSINRLVVVGEQISPDPSQNVAANKQQTTTAINTLPSNAPSLWSRLTSWLSS